MSAPDSERPGSTPITTLLSAEGSPQRFPNRAFHRRQHRIPALPALALALWVLGVLLGAYLGLGK